MVVTRSSIIFAIWVCGPPEELAVIAMRRAQFEIDVRQCYVGEKERQARI
jgi:hypothetical protein